MARQGARQSGTGGLRAWALALLAGWCVALATPTLAAPGFGVRGDNSGGASAGSRSGASSRSSGSVGSVTRPGPSSATGDRFRPGWGVRPDYTPGVRPPSDRSRDRFFNRRDAGSYGFFDSRRGTLRRPLLIYPFSDPFFYTYTSPFFSPFFSPFYTPFGYDIFSYHDWYLSPDRRYQPEPGREHTEEEWPARARGNVILDIQPRDVEVRINGVLTTRDGRAVLDLPTGTYRVEVSRPGYRTWTTELVVRQGIRYRLEFRLERGIPERETDAAGDNTGLPPRLVGEVVLAVTPDDAIARLDGRLLGVVNLLRGGTALKTIPVGRHVLELRRPGYRTLVREFEVDAGESLKLDLVLERE